MTEAQLRHAALLLTLYVAVIAIGSILLFAALLACGVRADPLLLAGVVGAGAWLRGEVKAWGRRRGDR